jgi:hypothetical protein
MVLHLSNGKTILCEHKLLAPETQGPEEDPRPQLERYLELPVDGLVYVRSSWRPPGETVLKHSNYVKPGGREHFLWRDFYPLLSPGQHVLIDWLRDGFDELGFTPPKPKVGKLKLRPEKSCRADALNFAKLWGRTKSVAHTLGWKVGTGSRIELYLYNPRSLASEIFISPAKPERFLFRVTPANGNMDLVRNAMTAAARRLPQTANVAITRQRRKAGLVEVVDVTTTLDEVVGSQRALAEELEADLLSFVEPLLRAAAP